MFYYLLINDKVRKYQKAMLSYCDLKNHTLFFSLIQKYPGIPLFRSSLCAESHCHHQENIFLLFVEALAVTYDIFHLFYIIQSRNNTNLIPLLKRGIKFINSTNSEKSNALHTAVQYNNIELVKTLIELGCNVNASNFFSNSL